MNNQLEIDKETIRLRESFLKQIMTISSGGLAIILGFNEKFLVIGTYTQFYYFTVVIWLVAICLALYVQGYLSRYFSEGVTLTDDINNLSNEISKFIDNNKNTIDRAKVNGFQEKLDSGQGRLDQYFKIDRIVKILSYTSLTCFALGVISISIGIYLN